jgi:hypothetical protein
MGNMLAINKRTRLFFLAQVRNDTRRRGGALINGAAGVATHQVAVTLYRESGKDVTMIEVPILLLMDEIELRHGVNEDRWGILRGILEKQAEREAAALAADERGTG